MRKEIMAAGVGLFLTSCSPSASGWPPPETGFQCINGLTEENAELLADERSRLELVGKQLNVDLSIINQEYGRRGLEAGCTQYDFIEAQEVMQRRENPDLADTI